MYHIDDAIEGNENELHPKVKLLEADNQAHLHNGVNRGDDGDQYPGRSVNTTIDSSSSPSSKSYGGVDTCVSLTNIQLNGASIKATVKVKCAGGKAPSRARKGAVAKTPRRARAGKAGRRR